MIGSTTQGGLDTVATRHLMSCYDLVLLMICPLLTAEGMIRNDLGGLDTVFTREV